MKNFTLLLIFSVSFTSAIAQGMLHYNFNNSLGEINGAGPVLKILGDTGVYDIDTLSEVNNDIRTVYRFEANSGLQFDNAAAGNFIDSVFTIELYFVFDELTSWKRVVDWKNRTTDKGAYVYYGQLNFYNYVYSDTAPVAPGAYTYYVITRSSNGHLLFYTDAATYVDFMDTGNDAVPDISNVLNFFHDDLIVPNEASSGAVAMLKLYDYALDSLTIVSHFNDLQEELSQVKEVNRSTTSVAVYPNPASNEVFFDFSDFKTEPDMRWSILDAAGSVLLQNIPAENRKPVCSLTTTDMPAGIYYLHCVAAGKIYRTRFVVSK